MKIVSLGYNCFVARFLSQIYCDGNPVRLSSPMDWNCQCTPTAVLKFINGDIFRNVVKGRFTTIYSPIHECVTTKFTDLDNELYHENLDDNNTLCKFITRLVHLSDYLKDSEVKFMYLIHPDNMNSKVINSLCKLIGRNRLFIVANSDAELPNNYDYRYLWDNDKYWYDNKLADEVNKHVFEGLKSWIGNEYNLEYKFNPGMSIGHKLNFDGSFSYIERKYDNLKRKYL
jgi:hypothetical protein